MKKPTKILLWTLLALVLAYLAMWWYVSATFELRIFPLSAEDRARINLVAEELSKLAQGVSNGTTPWRQVDRSSVGFPLQEANLVQLRNGIDFFAGSFGRQPSDASELPRLLTLPGMGWSQKHLYQTLAKECQILTLQPDSYILNCDGWNAPPWSHIGDLVRTFNREKEKFYAVQGHVILFVPSPVSGKPPALPGR